MNEAETRAEHIDPALAAAGWGALSVIQELVQMLLNRKAKRP